MAGATVLLGVLLLAEGTSAALPRAFDCEGEGRILGLRLRKTDLPEGTPLVVIDRKGGRATGRVRRVPMQPDSEQGPASEGEDDSYCRTAASASLVLDSAGEEAGECGSQGDCLALAGTKRVEVGGVTVVAEEGALQKRMLAASRPPDGSASDGSLARFQVPGLQGDFVFGSLSTCPRPRSECGADNAWTTHGFLFGPAPARKLLLSREKWASVVMVLRIDGEPWLLDYYNAWAGWHWDLEHF